MAERLLEVENLGVSFRDGPRLVQAVRGVSFHLDRGEALGIVGESGSGKSVSVGAVMGLLGGSARVDGGLRLFGKDLKTMFAADLRAARGRDLAMIFQEPSRSFDPIYSIGKTFEETLRAKRPGLTPAECRSRAIALLGEVHIPEPERRLQQFPHQFSGGMLQRIMIALSLANDPAILIADEPTTALDVTIQAQIVGLLQELRRQRGLSLIFISHDLGLVGQVADRIQVMYGGLVMESGPAAAVLASPRSPYTRALLKSLPAWGSHYSQDSLFTIPGNVPDPAQPEPGCPFAPRCLLAIPACSARSPDMVRDQETDYRCLVPGIKT